MAHHLRRRQPRLTGRINPRDVRDLIRRARAFGIAPCELTRGVDAAGDGALGARGP